ncbi:MAG: phospholipase D-like domain-containing protein [Chloroflexota bacterium]|nr:phospholipase D-like domain-containing protein [Chloroflexota bacterium]MDQ5867591.1 phospholipase D-like domain-containing protein [Chloroflexota bacterium]
MQVNVVDNHTTSVSEVLSSAIRDSNDVRMAVAFVSRSGYDLIADAIAQALGAGGTVELLAGMDMQGTEPEALETIYRLSRVNSNVSLYCYSALEPTAIYHPKLYLIRHEDDVTAIVGSSNLTAGGLKKNTEINLALKGTLHDEVVADMYQSYAYLKFHPKRVVPDEEFLSLYSQLVSTERRTRRVANNQSSIRGLRREFATKANSLRRPQRTPRDIVGGWLETVYDVLPDGQFTNADVYAHESLFRQRYPGNQTIKDKIRQQLQILARLGFVEHVGRGTWRKV